MYHLTVCVTTKAGDRDAFIISAATEAAAVSYAETFRNRIGYCGNASFAEAVTRCGLMQRNEPGGWGTVTP